MVDPHRESITCPVCRRTSYHPMDVTEGYCGNCHAFTGQPKQPEKDPLGTRPTTPAEIDNAVNPGAWKRRPPHKDS